MTRDLIAELAKEVLDDAELGRCTAEQLVLKANRLAREVKDEETASWLWAERFGYSDKEPDVTYMGYTGRWTDASAKVGYWGSIATQENMIEAKIAELEVLKNFKPSGEYAGLQLANQQQQVQVVMGVISTHRNIKSRVVSLIQNFAAKIYSARVLNKQAETIFNKYATQLEGQLANRAGDALEKFPAIFDRLVDDDKEAVSQALGSCRRVLDAFINNVHPPSEPQVLNGVTMAADEKSTRNRYRLYIATRTQSNSLMEKLNKFIVAPYDRTSTAVHNEVASGEARAIVLQMYVTLGEIISLGELPKVSSEEEEIKYEATGGTETNPTDGTISTT